MMAGIGRPLVAPAIGMAMAKPTRPAPKGCKWVFVTSFKHWRSKKIIRAADYGREAFCFLVRCR